MVKSILWHRNRMTGYMCRSHRKSNPRRQKRENINDKGGGEPPFYICEYPSGFVEKSIVIRL